MIRPQVWPALLLLALTGAVAGAPLDDLGSPSPKVRAEAAEIIRTQQLYQPTSRAPWDRLTTELKVGETPRQLAAFLRRHGLDPAFSFDRNAIYTFRLDDTWVLLCAVNRYAKDAPAVLTEFRIMSRPKEIFVAPPPGYTGTWRTYRINGQPFGPAYYVQGQPEVLL